MRGKDEKKKKKRVRYSQMFLLQLPALHKELNQNFRRSHPWPQEFTSQHFTKPLYSQIFQVEIKMHQLQYVPVLQIQPMTVFTVLNKGRACLTPKLPLGICGGSTSKACLSSEQESQYPRELCLTGFCLFVLNMRDLKLCYI